MINMLLTAHIIDVNTPIYKSVNHLLCIHVICLAL